MYDDVPCTNQFKISVLFCSIFTADVWINGGQVIFQYKPSAFLEAFTSNNLLKYDGQKDIVYNFKLERPQ